MNLYTLLNASIFYGWQISLIVLLCVIIAGLVLLSIYCGFKFRIVAERKMYNDELQQKRNALMDKLHYLYSGGEVDAHNWWFTYRQDDDENEDEDEDENITKVEVESGKQPMNTVLLCVDDLPPRVRTKLGMRPKRFNGKKFYVRYQLGFDAKLRYSDDETKARYTEIMNNIRSYDGVSVEKNFANLRIMYGKEHLATVLFAGKRLCVGFALEPTEELTSGKYRAEDKSDKKRFAKTPLVVRILSGENKTETVKYIFGKLAEQKGIAFGKAKKFAYDLAERSQEQLVTSGAVRVIIIADAPADATYENSVPQKPQLKSSAAKAEEEKSEQAISESDASIAEVGAKDEASETKEKPVAEKTVPKKVTAKPKTKAKADSEAAATENK